MKIEHQTNLYFVVVVFRFNLLRLNRNKETNWNWNFSKQFNNIRPFICFHFANGSTSLRVIVSCLIEINLHLTVIEKKRRTCIFH